ncbi:LOW QUALITY PROTEIN: uncharacterized protein LOC110821949 [Carica papaya]|uniref:LOW QUALITY PROTEIN: uncharacterized protein LOC110821949 n=1 Tax=Carica papaya TaxID=3649 RepID=UPI000B8C860A|nr:LOW QUALITY PROTEIN: uncharacterized protein LOC110821949 [Carica papaya]
MATGAQESVEQKPPQKLQIYSASGTGVSSFWRDKYERDAKKYWDIFYKRHQDRFFKDRHYLDKEWGDYFEGGNKVILEVGCGAGNTIFPLFTTYPDIFVHACDFSPRAINLVKTHKDFVETRVNAFVSDLTIDDLSKQISPSSVDIISMIFVLSAVSPEKMPLVLQNVRKVLKPNGCVLFRDYAVGDLAQERLTGKDQKISDNFYVRGDGTRAFYFSNDFLSSLFKENGFDVQELGLCCKQVENRSKELVMNRRWVQAVFRNSDCVKSSSGMETSMKTDQFNQKNVEPEVEKHTSQKPVDNLYFDMSEGLAIEMFGFSPSFDNEIIEVNIGNSKFKIKVLSKEYQHTCKSTGLMLWESARLMASIFAENPSIVAGKRVLELGCGCAGICSMVAVEPADTVVATDGDSKVLELLKENITSNLKPPVLTKLTTKILEWGNKDHIEAIKAENNGGFEIIVGTDVTYIPEAILPFFATARQFISSKKGICKEQEPALILCHVFRRVDESSLLSAASEFGFKLVDKWPTGISTSPYRNIIGQWFSEKGSKNNIPSSALNILYFNVD